MISEFFSLVFPHLKKMPSKTFKDSLARRFINDLRVLWFVSPTKAAVMKTWVHPYELGHTQGPDFFLCSRSLSSPCLCLLLSWLLYIWGKSQDLNGAPLTHAAAKGCPFRAQIIELRKIPITGGSLGNLLGSHPQMWAARRSTAVNFIKCSLVGGSVLLFVCFWQVVSL